MNRIPSPIIDNKSPHFIMTQQHLNMYDLKIFNSFVFAYTLQEHRTKLSHRARKCIFLSYKSCMKATIFLDINTKELFVSRNLIRHEKILPYQPHSSHSNWTYHTNPDQTNQSITIDHTFPTNHPIIFQPNLNLHNEPEPNASLVDYNHPTEPNPEHENTSPDIVNNNQENHIRHVR